MFEKSESEFGVNSTLIIVMYGLLKR